MQTKNKPKIQTAMHSISITESQGVSRVHNQGSMACNGATNIWVKSSTREGTFCC